jgi:hypothetical protein
LLAFVFTVIALVFTSIGAWNNGTKWVR